MECNLRGQCQSRLLRRGLPLGFSFYLQRAGVFGDLLCLVFIWDLLQLVQLLLELVRKRQSSGLLHRCWLPPQALTLELLCKRQRLQH